MLDLAMVLKRVGKVLVSLDCPKDQKLLEVIKKLLKKSMQEDQDDEIKAMLPCILEGLSYLYRKDIHILVDLY